MQTIPHTLCQWLRLYGMQPVVIPPTGAGQLVTVRCAERACTFNPGDAPASMFERIEWLHDRMREVLPEGWAPPRYVKPEQAHA